MIIQGMGHQYEVIRKSVEKGKAVHYLCRDNEEDRLWNLQEIEGNEAVTRMIPWAMELEAAGAVSEWREAVLDRDRLLLVFFYEGGFPLKEYLAAAPVSLEKRYGIGRLLLERLVLSTLPVWMKWEMAEAGRILVDGGDRVNFWYEVTDAPYELVTEDQVWKRLAEVFFLLFEEECGLGLYPEFQELIESCNCGSQTLLEGMKAYLDLMPAAFEDRTGQAEAGKTKEEESAGKKPITIGKKAAAWVIKVSAVVILCASVWKTGPFFWDQIIYPRIEAKYLVKTLCVSDPLAKSHTGRVKLLFDGTQTTAWEGVLENGRKTGSGISYYENGNVEYEGNYEDGWQSGTGILWDKRGRLWYEGSFDRGRFEGEGCLYENGEPVYKGGFSKGVYEGEGVRFYQGSIQARGTFENGSLAAGTGVLVDENGDRSYEGEIKDGKRAGKGAAYEAGRRIYEGLFDRDLYQGMGKLYSPDTGGMIYEGEFEEGLYCGQGKRYEPDTGYLIYEGEFRLGRYDGEGKEYDSSGCLAYQGNFCLGIRQGYGILYDPATGKTVAEGEFRNGILITPKEELEPEKEEKEADEEPLSEPEASPVEEPLTENSEIQNNLEKGPGIGLGD